MFNDKIIAAAFMERFKDQIWELLNTNKSFTESENELTKTLAKKGMKDFEYEDLITNLIVSAIEVAYFKGIGDGAKIQQELVSNNIANLVMEAFDDKAC